VQASVGSHCLDCAKAARPDLKTRAKWWSARQAAFVTYTIIAVNVAFFAVLALLHDPGDMLSGRLTEGHVDWGLNEVFLQGETLFSGGTVVTDGDEWYRLLTAGFLHFGLLHLALNMYFLYILGGELEPVLGRVRFLALYVAGILGGAAGSLLIDDIGYVASGDQLIALGGISGGASGAVFALLGAYATGVWQHGVNPLSTSIGSLLLINLVLTFLVPRISIGGHIGGLVAGAICGFVMLAPGYKGFPAWSRLVAPIAVGVVAVAVSVVAVA
jgi:membrane associated rhomboid family serine protease